MRPLVLLLALAAPASAADVSPQWSAYVGRFASPAEVPFARSLGLDLGSRARLESFLRVMDRARLAPDALASAATPAEQAAALQSAVGRYAAPLSARVDALCERGRAGKTLRDAARELDDLALVKDLVPASQRAALRSSHEAAAFLINLADDAEMRSLDARGREIRALWGDKEASGVVTAAPEAAKRRETPPEWRLQKPSGALSRAGLDAVFATRPFSPQALLAELKKDPFLASQFAADAGVDEGYSLERHTLMVLTQFERYFGGRLPAGVDRDLLRLTLALHDIGKPQAIREGMKERQHELTRGILRRYLPRLGYGERQAALATALTSDDVIGRYVQVSGLSRAAEGIRAAAREAGMSAPDFLELSLILYMADAGSYTKDAGGRAVLDYLFVFDRAAGEMRFAPRIVERIDALRREVRR